MTEISDANVTPLRPAPSPVTGEGISRTVKDRTATERKRRSRAKRKQCDRHITAPGHGVTVPVTAPVTGTAGSIGRYVAAGLLGAVGIGLSAIGMVETASYSLAVGGFLFCALAMAADVLTLVMPATIGALWRKRSTAVVLAGLLWCAGVAVTVVNIAGYVGEHIEQYQVARKAAGARRRQIQPQRASWVSRLKMSA